MICTYERVHTMRVRRCERAAKQCNIFAFRLLCSSDTNSVLGNGEGLGGGIISVASDEVLEQQLRVGII